MRYHRKGHSAPGAAIRKKKNPTDETGREPGQVRGVTISPVHVVMAAALLLVGAFGSTRAESGDPPPGPSLQLSSDLRVVVLHGREVELQVRATGKDDFGSIAARVGGDGVSGRDLAKRNAPTKPGEGVWIGVAATDLRPELRSLVLRNLFPADREEGGDWVHLARAGRLPTYDEGLWQVAEWFVGRGRAFTELMETNGLSSPELREGQPIRIPAALVHPAFHARLRSDDGALEYGTDGEGPFAVYRLQPGEALYSAVVLRFTGRTGADDVRETADRLLARSNLRDPRDIPAGFEIKIPLDLLEPEHLPKEHPRRKEAEENRLALARELARAPVAGTRGGLEGVLVILDPGHGGRDLGTVKHGIWEHDYVYDVACRLKQMLETETAAQVVMTLEDKKTGCKPSTGDKLVANQQGSILTSPAFLAKEEGEARIGVNLRWYLANSVYRKAVKNGTRADRVVFLSLHADSRHAALSGAMVYVPGERYCRREEGSNSATYRKYREVREKPTIRFGTKERVRSEAVSRKLADRIVESMRHEGLPIHPYQPVRDKVIRGKQRWVPAVLRGTAVPAKVLVEMLNLNNKDDAKLMASARTRQRLARSLQLALYRYFGERPGHEAAATKAAR
jgi:N-acetylmuramoyl-L-alanine amidase